VCCQKKGNSQEFSTSVFLRIMPILIEILWVSLLFHCILYLPPIQCCYNWHIFASLCISLPIGLETLYFSISLPVNSWISLLMARIDPSYTHAQWRAKVSLLTAVVVVPWSRLKVSITLSFESSKSINLSFSDKEISLLFWISARSKQVELGKI